MLDILSRDDYLAAVHKPPGLLVHRTGLDAGETRFALQVARDRPGVPVWPVHRRDKGTSGVPLFALDAETARTLALAFEQGGGIQTTYRAVTAHLGVQRLWLHAWRLVLRHPATGAALSLIAPPGPEWAAWHGCWPADRA